MPFVYFVLFSVFIWKQNGKVKKKFIQNAWRARDISKVYTAEAALQLHC